MSLTQIFKWLRSVKFTVILLALLIVMSAISTFSAEPGAFFSSLGCFALAFLFFVNLCCCTFYRFSNELKKKANRNFGPDILHGGLVLFMVFALISVYSRMEGQIMLTIGESALLPDGNVLILDDFEYQQYENGRPKDWISYLTIEHDGEVIFLRHPLRVNHPLTMNVYTLYQVSYANMGGKEYSVIQAVREPFFALVLAAFIICGIGAFVTLFIKLKKLSQRST
jgi:cytochrome c biogenesis factor